MPVAVHGTYQTPRVHNEPSSVSTYVRRQRFTAKRLWLLLHQPTMQNMPMRWSRSNIYVCKICLKSHLVNFSLFTRTPSLLPPIGLPHTGEIRRAFRPRYCFWELTSNGYYYLLAGVVSKTDTGKIWWDFSLFFELDVNNMDIVLSGYIWPQ